MGLLKRALQEQEEEPRQEKETKHEAPYAEQPLSFILNTALMVWSIPVGHLKSAALFDSKLLNACSPWQAYDSGQMEQRQLSNGTLTEEVQVFPFVHIVQHQTFQMQDEGKNLLLNTA